MIAQLAKGRIGIGAQSSALKINVGYGCKEGREEPVGARIVILVKIIQTDDPVDRTAAAANLEFLRESLVIFFTRIAAAPLRRAIKIKDLRSEELRVGQQCVGTVIFGWSP